MCVGAMKKRRMGDGHGPFVIRFVACSHEYALSRGAEGGSRLRGSGQKKALVSAGRIAMPHRLTHKAFPGKCQGSWVGFPVLGNPRGLISATATQERVCAGSDRQPQLGAYSAVAHIQTSPYAAEKDTRFFFFLLRIIIYNRSDHSHPKVSLSLHVRGVPGDRSTCRTAAFAEI